jgi:hypothetical protein
MSLQLLHVLLQLYSSRLCSLCTGGLLRCCFPAASHGSSSLLQLALELPQLLLQPLHRLVPCAEWHLLLLLLLVVVLCGSKLCLRVRQLPLQLLHKCRTLTLSHSPALLLLLLLLQGLQLLLDCSKLLLQFCDLLFLCPNQCRCLLCSSPGPC